MTRGTKCPQVQTLNVVDSLNLIDLMRIRVLLERIILKPQLKTKSLPYTKAYFEIEGKTTHKFSSMCREKH